MNYLFFVSINERRYFTE